MRPTTFTSLELPVVTSIEPEPVSTCRFTVPLTRRVRLNWPRAEAEANPESKTTVTTAIREKIVADRIMPPWGFTQYCDLYSALSFRAKQDGLRSGHPAQSRNLLFRRGNNRVLDYVPPSTKRRAELRSG